MSNPWILTHRPTALCEVAGQEQIIKELQTYIETYRGQKKKAALLKVAQYYVDLLSE